MFRTWGKKPLSTVLRLTSASLLLGMLGGCHAILGLDKYEKGAASGGQGGENPGASGGRGQTGGEGGDGRCASSEACDDKNSCTEDVCTDLGQCENRTKTAGEKCDGGVCNGLPGEEACQRCVDDQPGGLTDAGCTSGAPQCRTSGKIQCVGCEKHADCNDNNDCTIDACNTTDGGCGYRPVAAGDACDGGVCNGVEGAEKCIECVDSEEGTDVDDGCDVTAPLCSDGKCEVCIDDHGGASKDLGCTSGAPICAASGCVECRNAADCTAPNEECAVVACDGGSCVVTLDDERCTGNEGCPGSCQEGGCETQSGVFQQELIADGSLESVDPETGDEPWMLFKSIDGDDYENADDSEYPNVFVTSSSARTGTRVARFDTVASLSYDIAQYLYPPEQTNVLVISGYYRSIGEAAPSNENYINGAFYNYDDQAIQFHDYFMSTKTGEPSSVAPVAAEWTKFEWRVTDFSDFPTSSPPELNIFALKKNQAGLYYEVDDISVKALVCE